MIYFAFPSLFPPLLYRSFVCSFARSREGVREEEEREREIEREREKKNSNYVYIVCIYARGDVFVTSITYLGGIVVGTIIYIYILHHLRYLVLFLSIEILCYTTSLLLVLLLSHS